MPSLTDCEGCPNQCTAPGRAGEFMGERFVEMESGCELDRDPETCPLNRPEMTEEQLRDQFDAEMFELAWMDFAARYHADPALVLSIPDVDVWQEASCVQGALDRAFETWKEERNP